MKKFLFLITALTALSTAVLTSCNMKDSTNGDTVADITSAVTEETTSDEENNGTGFDYIPKKLNGRAVTAESGETDEIDETNPDNGEQPKRKKCRRHRRRHSHGTELFIIHFGRGIKDDDSFKPHYPLKPVVPDKDPETPEEPEETENPENN